METLGISWGNVAYSQSDGNGPTLVFLHGTGCDSSDWHGVLRSLPPGIGSLCVDFRGHGESSVPDEDFQFSDLAADINLVLEILHVDHPLVVGHSLGGMVGIELATQCQLAGLVSIEGWTKLGLARNAFAKGRRWGKLTQEQIQEIDRKRDDTLARFGGDQWRGFWHTVQEFDGSHALETHDIPIWEIYGTHLANTDARDHLLIPDRSNIQVEWIDGCGHYIPHEAPEAIAEICQRAHTACG
jgi:pimeloyl-ACP methyl ester carboxylesterase